MEGTVIQFQQLRSGIDVQFWHALCQNKLDVQKLSEEAIDIRAHIGVHSGSAHLKDQTMRVNIGPDAFSEEAMPPPMTVELSGKLTNTNTIESFQALDKKSLLKETGAKLHEAIVSGEAIDKPTLLQPFVMITHSDLKKYRFLYWCAFPALPLSSPITHAAPVSALSSTFSPEIVASIAENFHTKREWVMVMKVNGTSAEFAPLSQFEHWTDDDNVHVIVSDTCGLPEHCGWPVRNVLYALALRFAAERVSVVCVRSDHNNIDASIVISANLPKPGELKTLGWEKNAKGKLGLRKVELGGTMDPKQLAGQQIDLNLKLMKWRLMPSLDLEKIANTKCLLLGSGTLGCNVARALLGWGVRHITFLDNGKVSFSNPVRQSLFTFEDCLNGGLPKAVAAAKHMKEIFPGVTCEGVELSIPMPGHPVADNESAKVKANVEQLIELINSHDVVYLLMDSRESRWLPTLLCQVVNKICINAALGFDTFMVMRHGASPLNNTDEDRVGCYFCNDVVAPQDSLSNRTLDQQCTVTRPGVSYMAGALAVEIMVSLLNHPMGIAAPPDTNSDVSNQAPTPLGIVPHQIRGYLSHFQNNILLGHAYERCTACSEIIVSKYLEDGMDFLFKAFNSPSYLEDCSGLTAMKDSSVDFSIDWEEASDDDFDI